ncbi:glutamate 5-kinase [Hirschia litorea]|uniref:Glutamate 5-kinase n=1 Tax=Hirschia litorea TaxID=1199156 RepID=A0ABW2IMI0_9PROT
MQSGAEYLSSAKRIVIKLGSALLINAEGKANAARIQAISRDIISLRAQGKQIVIVSSGSIALGRKALKLKSGALKLEEKQAAAASGQIRLMRAWEDAFAVHNVPVAQALLTLDDTEIRRRWLNARATLNTLLEAGAIPIVNENDTVATEEIRYGDNDRLAARVAQMTGADVLVLLSDIDGLYTADPRNDPSAKHIPVVTDLTPDIMNMGGSANAQAGVGSGGMATKLQAARIAMTAGCATVITRGEPTDAASDLPMAALKNGALATWFIPPVSPDTARIQWLMGSLKPAGKVTVDAGASRALRKGKSLLPAGVTHIEGHFDRGDAIEVVDPQGHPVSRGISAYSSEDATRLIGRNSSEIESILGFKGRPALIHCDDLILL